LIRWQDYIDLEVFAAEIEEENTGDILELYDSRLVENIGNEPYT